jgi:hypothetical protein
MHIWSQLSACTVTSWELSCFREYKIFKSEHMEACGTILECEGAVCYFGYNKDITREIICVLFKSVKGSTFRSVFRILISVKVCVTIY